MCIITVLVIFLPHTTSYLVKVFHAQSTIKALIAGAEALMFKTIESLIVRNNFTFETINNRLFEQKNVFRSNAINLRTC